MSKATGWWKEKNSTFWVVELGVIDAVPQSPFVSFQLLVPPSNFFLFTQVYKKPTINIFWVLYFSFTVIPLKLHRFAKVNQLVDYLFKDKEGLLIVRLRFMRGLLLVICRYYWGHCWKYLFILLLVFSFACWLGWPQLAIDSFSMFLLAAADVIIISWLCCERKDQHDEKFLKIVKAFKSLPKFQDSNLFLKFRLKL